MRTHPIAVDSTLPLALLLLLLPTLLLRPAASQTPPPTYSLTPAPSYNTNYGGESVSSGFIRTLEPTLDVAALTGRGMPSRIPTDSPTNDPTAEDFGTDFEVSIPGFDMSQQPGDGDGDGGEVTGIPAPADADAQSQPPAPAMATVPSQAPSGGAGMRRTASDALVFAASVGCATLLLVGWVGQ